MTSRGFAFLMLVTVAAVMLTGWLAGHFAEPGLQRTLVVAIGSGLIVFPASRWAEKRGWIKGTLQLGNIKEEFLRNPAPTSKSGSAPKVTTLANSDNKKV